MKKAEGPCSVEGCGYPKKSRDYCASHYQRVMTGRDVNVKIIRRQKETEKRVKNKGRLCNISGCVNHAESRGMCNSHYIRFSKYGYNKYPDRKTELKTCEAEGCDGIVLAKGLCNRCYRRKALWSSYGLDENSYSKIRYYVASTPRSGLSPLNPATHVIGYDALHDTAPTKERPQWG